MVYVTKEDPKWMDDIEEWSGCS